MDDEIRAQQVKCRPLFPRFARRAPQASLPPTAPLHRVLADSNRHRRRFVPRVLMALRAGRAVCCEAGTGYASTPRLGPPHGVRGVAIQSSVQAEPSYLSR